MQALRVLDDEDREREPPRVFCRIRVRGDQLCGVVGRVLRDGVRQAAGGIDDAVQHVDECVAALLAGEARPQDSSDFGFSIHGSTMAGPTECTTTTVLLFTTATALMSASTFSQSVRLERSLAMPSTRIESGTLDVLNHDSGTLARVRVREHESDGRPSAVVAAPTRSRDARLVFAHALLDGFERSDEVREARSAGAPAHRERAVIPSITRVSIRATSGRPRVVACGE